LILDLPGRCSGREEFIVREAGKDFNTLPKLTHQDRNGEKMNEPITYSRPSISVLGSVAEMICGTHFKDHRGIVEATHRRILPAYDLDE
jgi:hypothetical protein